MISLSFMGVCDPEPFRARIYGQDEKCEAERVAFVRRLAKPEGVLDCRAYDGWIHALWERHWLADPEEVPVRSGGHYRCWRLNEAGRAALAHVIGGA